MIVFFYACLHLLGRGKYSFEDENIENFIISSIVLDSDCFENKKLNTQAQKFLP